MIDTLTPFKDPKYIPLEKALKQLEKYNPTTMPPAAPKIPPLTATTGFSIESLADTYRISGVALDGENHVVGLDKALLDGGKSHSQDEWSTMNAKLPSAKLYTAIILALYANKDHTDDRQKALVEEVKKLLKHDFKGYFMMTSTRVAYQPQGKDRVMHNHGYANEQTVDEDIVGSDGYIDANCGFDKELEALLGTSDCTRIEQACEWLGGKKPYLCRVYSKPQQEELRAVVLGLNVSNNGFLIDVANDDVIDIDGPARGCDLVAQKIEAAAK